MQITDPSIQDGSKLDLISHIVKFRLHELKQSRSYLAVIVLLSAAIFFVQDIYIDVAVEEKGLSHLVTEGGIFLAVLLALAIEVKRVVQLHASINDSRKEMLRLKGHLAEVISDEFDRWQLTKTE